MDLLYIKYGYENDDLICLNIVQKDSLNWFVFNVNKMNFIMNIKVSYSL